MTTFGSKKYYFKKVRVILNKDCGVFCNVHIFIFEKGH